MSRKKKMKKNSKALSQAVLAEEYYRNMHDAYDGMKRVFRLWLEKGHAQEDLAELLDVNKSVISRRLCGEKNLTLRTMSYMATAMGCSLNVGWRSKQVGLTPTPITEHVSSL